MWITKTVFIGSSGNETIEINKSTDKEWANIKRDQQIDRWYHILVDSEHDVPSQLIYTYFRDIHALRLDMIHFVLDLKNKYNNDKEVENKFTIEVYESPDCYHEKEIKFIRLN
jgi:hypothetical protein